MKNVGFRLQKQHVVFLERVFYKPQLYEPQFLPKNVCERVSFKFICLSEFEAKVIIYGVIRLLWTAPLGVFIISKGKICRFSKMLLAQLARISHKSTLYLSQKVDPNNRVIKYPYNLCIKMLKISERLRNHYKA